MHRTTVLAIALSIAGCNAKQDHPGSGAGASSASITDEVTLNASGSTFQKAAQEVAIEGFTRANPRIKINYSGGGSGKGRQDFADQVVDYACTDAPYKDADRAKLNGGELSYIPNVLGAITVSYHVVGIDRLQLSAPTLARIFQREIKTWNDPAIVADNPGAKLPATEVVVARRSDGSGTTENFTRFLELASEGAWRLRSGSTVEWPADTQAGNGNGGVAQIVKSTDGAIGYVDLSDAKASGLTYAAIKNQAGTYVDPTAESVTAAGDGIAVNDDLTFSALNARGDAAYPMTAQSWCMAYAKQTDEARGTAVKAYLKYLVTDGQALLADIDFAPIPKSLQDRAVAAIDRIAVP